MALSLPLPVWYDSGSTAVSPAAAGGVSALLESRVTMETHILVVDDETAIADLVEVCLKNEGFAVHKCNNAADALVCVRWPFWT